MTTQQNEEFEEEQRRDELLRRTLRLLASRVRCMRNQTDV